MNGYTKKDLEDWKLAHPEEIAIIEKNHSSKYKQTCSIIVSMAIAKMHEKEKTIPMDEEPSKPAPDPT